jgi:hypothetical protein
MCKKFPFDEREIGHGLSIWVSTTWNPILGLNLHSTSKETNISYPIQKHYIHTHIKGVKGNKYLKKGGRRDVAFMPWYFPW